MADSKGITLHLGQWNLSVESRELEHQGMRQEIGVEQQIVNLLKKFMT